MKAPLAAKLMRAIAEGRKIKKAHPARLYEYIREASAKAGLPPLADPGQVYRWWKGEARIGLTNRHRLLAAFPEFAREIEDTVNAEAIKASPTSSEGPPTRSTHHAAALDRFHDLLSRPDFDEADAMKITSFLAAILETGEPYERFQPELMIAVARAKAAALSARAAQSTSVPYLPHERPPPTGRPQPDIPHE